MEDKMLGELVRDAKGEDRSIREYARASGVDPAVISKIIKGDYTPKKTKVYMMLTSENAAPRNGITYEQLVAASQSSKAYQDGVAAGVEMVENLSDIARIALSSTAAAIDATGDVVGNLGRAFFPQLNKKTNHKDNVALVGKIKAEILRFVNMTKALIYGQFVFDRIHVTETHQFYDSILHNQFDTYLKIEEGEIEQLIVRYAYFTKKDSDKIIENMILNYVGPLVLLPYDPKRKVSIATNSRRAFDYLTSLAGNISYKGNLSVMLINDEEFQIEGEVIVSSI